MNLRILSYNIHRAIGVDRRFYPERIAKVLAHHDADLVLLQEVDAGAPRSRELNLARELAKLGDYPYYAVGLNVQLRKGMYGNATLSRYPIARERNIDLTLDGRKARGCLFTELELPAGAAAPLLPVFNLHLGLSFKERPQQVGRLVRAPEFTSLSKDAPCVVAGDFNDWWTRLAPLFTEALGFVCATNHGVGYQNAILTYPSFSPTTGLDKVFCRGPITILSGKRCRLRISKVASDHLPVIVDLQL
ncbi:MAG: endonuclease [Deltaproteobacteria bacterium RIFOXYD12_FULL_55_16]|nr:MAG: endonuclease [Deltaproteobacteria bacterium RIFOXYD12_FULL_55_16]